MKKIKLLFSIFFYLLTNIIILQAEDIIFDVNKFYESVTPVFTEIQLLTDKIHSIDALNKDLQVQIATIENKDQVKDLKKYVNDQNTEITKKLESINSLNSGLDSRIKKLKIKIADNKTLLTMLIELDTAQKDTDKLQANYIAEKFKKFDNLLTKYFNDNSFAIVNFQTVMELYINDNYKKTQSIKEKIINSEKVSLLLNELTEQYKELYKILPEFIRVFYTIFDFNHDKLTSLVQDYYKKNNLQYFDMSMFGFGTDDE